MDNIVKELGLSSKNIFSTASPNLFTVVVHTSWLKKWMKNVEVDNSVNQVDFTLQIGESVVKPWRKIFIKVLNKNQSKVLPLPRYKLIESNAEVPFSYAQLLQYISQNNHRNLWKDAYKKHCYNNESNKESAIVNLVDHDQLLTEIILRLYGCNIIKIKADSSGKFTEFKEIVPNRYVSRTYETHVNLLAALFTLETDNNYYIVYRGHYENNLLDCLNFSPNVIDASYSRGLFVVYQLLNAVKALGDRGLSIGNLMLHDIYLSENLWLQILPIASNNVHSLDPSLISEQNRSKQAVCNSGSHGSPIKKKEKRSCRSEAIELERLCNLWIRGRISNLDYLLHLNILAGRSANDPQAHFLVPWVTDFASRCGRNWRDLSKSKYRLNKGDRQLDLTFDVSSCVDQIPHHVSDAMTDITCYVYLARRTPKDVLCKYVRNKWVPAEYPASIQRMQQWTPDECIPEFYTDPTVFKSVHEDLPDLAIPTWATCVEDFITKHREALESSHVSEHLHHWIDITFGYKLSGAASVKAKNVCLSLVDGHSHIRRGGTVQVLRAPHPPKQTRPSLHAPPTLLPIYTKKSSKPNDSSEDASEEEDSSSLPQHVSRLNIPSQRVRSRHKSSNRARSLSKHHISQEDTQTIENRASSHSRHYRVQKSELGKDIIYLPKEFNFVASIQALETLDNFKTKCFFSKAEDKDKIRDDVPSNIFSLLHDENDKSKSIKDSEDTAFTNHMFEASYEQKGLKKFSQDAHLEQALKERKNRYFNNRYTADASVYKQFVSESRRQDMLVVGCLIIEIFLHNYMRPLRTNDDNFVERFNNCRTVLKYNFHSLPKCVSYIASLLLDVKPPGVNYRKDVTQKKEETLKKIIVTDKGLPPPTPSQLLQPLLMQHLIPFPQSFNILFKLLSTLHEYELTSNELNILYSYECDGVQCGKYENLDKTKLNFSLKIAEGKIQACISHLDIILNQVTDSQFDVMDIFLTHYIELLQNRDTSVLAAWYLFDTVSKNLGPVESRRKLLKHILNLYDDDEYIMDKPDKTEESATSINTNNKHKFVKLYHHIFLLQLMVRFGLQCFLDNFTQHLVEAVGGYKDVTKEAGSPGHFCYNRSMANKKPRYSDENVKNVLNTTSDIFSPDTSYGSENVITPNVDKNNEVTETLKEKDVDNKSENELFHFENDKERLPSRSSRSKSPAESIDSYTLSTGAPETMLTPSPANEVFTPKDTSPNMNRSSVTKELNLVVGKDRSPVNDSPTRGPISPSIEIPKKSLFTSYLHFADDDSKDVETFEDSKVKSLELNTTNTPKSSNDEENSVSSESCKISDMSSESLFWLAHRLGPVLTCRYITRNLLKMLSLCYVGKDNLAPYDDDDKDEFDKISIANSRVVGDRNAMKVIKCLTSIAAMYGEQIIIFQYLPHMGELIASCRKRLSAPLEGGVIACLQLVKYLLPHMCDAKVMEQLQDTFLKTILQPALRLSSTSRCAYPSGSPARRALVRKLLDALYALALRVGPEMTRVHLCVPPLQRFFLAFDKASGKMDNWPKPDESNFEKSAEQESSEQKPEGFLELCRDGSTAEWTVRDGRVVRADLPDVACTPPDVSDKPDTTRLTAQEELVMVFNEQLAHQIYGAFSRYVGAEATDRCLKNPDTVRAMCRSYENNITNSFPMNINADNRFHSSFSDDYLQKAVDMDHISSSNSFGSNVTLVGNRIDVANDAKTGIFDAVACKVDNGLNNCRHLRGDWLIYWEHEIGRPDKETRFNLKQIKLQTFVGHTQTVKSIYCLDNEGSFMSGSKDKTVRLWSLRNQGDGNATTQCNWSYTGHKKGVLSLSFLESQRLAVSTDSVVHIWDPFMETVVSQLENIKTPISIVRALPGPSPVVMAATTEATLKVIDARAALCTHDLKLPTSTATFIRCVAVSAGGTWAACGLASGHVVVVDTRTGQPLAQWRAHDGEVLRLAAVDDHKVLSSGLDQVTALWRVDDGELVAHLKGTTEPVHCLSIYYDELISGTTNNRIGVHTSLTSDASFSSTKLRSDTFKGVLTCMSVLPLNRLLLLGSDNGSISLLC